MARKRATPRRAKRTGKRAPSRVSELAREQAAAGADIGAEPPIEVAEFHPVEVAEEAAEPVAEAVPEATEELAVAADEHGALVRVDPLSRYLAEIRRFPLLTREEESEIAKRYHEQQDLADAYRLVTANLRLVVKIAFEFARASRNVLDLIQEGNIGLMEAVKNFDPYRGIRFPSYAVWWVRAYIYRYLINNWRLVRIGTTQAQRKLFFNLRKESERLEALGFTASPQLLAQRIGVKESEVREMQERMGHSEVSLDQPAGGVSDDTSLIDVIPDAAHNPEDAAAEAEWRSFARTQVEQFAATLKDKELEIFQHRLRAEEPATLQQIGERLGISRERVRQIETRLKQRLKEFIKSHAADVDSAGTS
jgi:RNA polymerase sigma-32 factor